jgi:parallel beta-helix repeat protein
MKTGICKIALITVFLLSSFFCSAHTYYISSSHGNDNNSSLQAMNPITPWKSIAQLNSFFKQLNAGDSILFARGEVFYGAITITKSGAAFAPIYIGAYGTGSKPEINGLLTLKNWIPVKNGIYESACSTAGVSLLLDGAQQPLGRYPNSGYLTYRSHQLNSSITGLPSSNTINWTGAEVVIRKNRWVIDKSTVIDHTGNTIRYAPGTKALPTDGYGYFIQNNLKTLDRTGEWYFDIAQNKMFVCFGNKNPDSYVVKTSFAGSLVTIDKQHYITFNDLAFTGAGKNTFNLLQAKNITISNCRIGQTTEEAILASYSPFLAVINSFINHSLSGGINLDVGCTNATLLNNEIRNTGLIAGMGKSGTGTYEGITSFGDNTRIEKNIIDSTGYNGIYFGGNTSLAKNNYITYFCLTKDDGAGIYLGDWSKTVNKKVIGNIILHGIGNKEGTTAKTSLQAEGIYIDDNTESVIIANNTIALCTNNGIKIHNAKDIEIIKNVVFNNGVQLRLEQDHYLATSTYIRNNTIRKNTFFSENKQQPTAKFSTHQKDLASFGSLDSNYYNAPKNEFLKIKTLGAQQFTREIPATAILFEYNATNLARKVKLKQSYTDVQNRIHRDEITIDPYSSVLLVSK